MKDILVVYGSKHGSTAEVAAEIAATLAEAGFDIDLRLADEKVDPAEFRAAVIGGSLYVGRWHADARAFLRTHRDRLAEMPVAAFALGPGTEKESDWSSSREQLERALAKVPDVKPVAVEIFGGVVDPDQLPFPFSHMPAVDLRDWEAIRSWARALPTAFGLARDAATA